MKETVLIAVDAGKHTTKSQLLHDGIIHTCMFRTKLQEVKNLGIELQDDSYHIQYDDKEYLLGNMVSEDYSNFDLNKASLPHKLAIYTTIICLLQKAGLEPHQVNLRLAVNIPINFYADLTFKESYKNFIENNGNLILLSVNGKTYNFRLSNITVCFEGMGIVYEKMDEYDNKDLQTIIIDIGGLNVNYCTFNGIHPVFDTMTINNMGINILKGKIGKSLSERFGIALSQNDLERIIKQGYLTHKGAINMESKQLIEHIMKEHFQQIIQFAQSKGYTFNNAEIQFSGGGSLLLKNLIEKEFSSASIVVNPVFANVRSFLKILEVKNA